MSDRIIVWFSCGAASAVAAKVSVEAFGNRRPVEVVNVDMGSDEHPDNERFLLDVERWIGQPIIRIRNDKYTGIHDVFLKERWIAGPSGAACTKRLKREAQEQYATLEDTKVVGYTSDEQHRVKRLRERFPAEKFLFVLADYGIAKEECYRVLSAASIELPMMYRLGYDHNNCLGCVKGGMGYWNKIRRDFPERFQRMAEIERELNYPITGTFLDTLDPEAGRDVKEPDIECGLYCGDWNHLIPLTVKKIAS